VFKVPKRLYMSLTIRVMAGAIAVYFLNLALRRLPLLIVSLIYNTAPIFTALFGWLVLEEKISYIESISLFVCFVGVYFLVDGE
jgi:drug/metabolite transporter (DMT)-like permease